MSEKKPFYITTPIFYPNANLHLGHAYVMTIADIVARYHRLKGDDTYFLAGSDDNTAKIFKSAEEKGQSVPEYLEHVAQGFRDLYTSLDISYDQFIRTSDKEKHWPGAIKLWNNLVENGDIYPSEYEGLYCTACETFYTEKDLIDGKCPIHGTVPERIKEKNYFFKLSKYGAQIKEKIESGEMEIVPASRKNEILAFIGRGLEDISFSRPKHVVPHAIPVPNDPDQVMYVWCDALVNYISALGYGRDDDSLFKKFWPADYQVIGKDILRFHAAIWPAMLLSAGLPLPKKILVHGLIMSGGQKMSKSIGNVIDPNELIKEYGADALRYYLARKISLFEDGDMTLESFKDAYNGDLANGLGNLVSRVMKMAQDNLQEPVYAETVFHKSLLSFMNEFEIQKAANHIWEEIAELDRTIQTKEPFKLVKFDAEKGREIIKELAVQLKHIATSLAPFMPETSQKILDLIKENKAPEAPLFMRKD
jgi:methionyl-tRNA synthetase